MFLIYCDLLWFYTYQKETYFLFLYVRVELPMLIILHPPRYPGFSFISMPVAPIEQGQIVRSLINTIHIQLEEDVTWSVCLSLS